MVDKTTGRLTVKNAALELVIETREGINPCRLTSRTKGVRYADGDYIWGFGEGSPRLVGQPKISTRDNGDKEIRLVGRSGDLEIEQRFLILENAPALEEQVTIRNLGATPLDTAAFACGFSRRVRGPQGWVADIAQQRFLAIPYKRDPETGEVCDWSLTDLAEGMGWYYNDWSKNKVMTPASVSEGWAWVNEAETLLILKYNPRAMEWSLVQPQPDADGIVLRFGGAGRGKRGDPEEAAKLAPGAEFAFGVTRYEICPAQWKSAFYAFRRFMESKGHNTPADYNPPVHWNEYYDNNLFAEGEAQDSPERRAEFYSLTILDEEIRKALELGCESLYLDPGWDTSFASSIWDAKRLGPQEEFVRRMREQHGFPIGMHTPLAGWSDIKAYPAVAKRQDAEGKTLESLCSTAPAYLEEKAKRLIELGEKGAYFLMFDGSQFTGECWDKAHGHSLPLTRQEHCEAYRELLRRVKERCPQVTIELHDPISGGSKFRYTPTYFLHGGKYGFDELWGYEYMCTILDHLYSSRALSLYYVNLAYSLPIYLHIDLRSDNENALGFWWYASTCRHLGVGGRPKEEKVWNAHKQALQTYLRQKRFYTQGEFFGITETAHAHTLAGEGRCLLDCFNLADVEVEQVARFSLQEIGLSGKKVESLEGAEWQMVGEELRLRLTIPARAHRQVELQVRP